MTENQLVLPQGAWRGGRSLVNRHADRDHSSSSSAAEVEAEAEAEAAGSRSELIVFGQYDRWGQ